MTGLAGTLGRYANGSRSVLQNPRGDRQQPSRGRYGGQDGRCGGRRQRHHPCRGALMADATTTATLDAAAALAGGLQAVAEAVRLGCADPAHAVVLLAQMAGYAPTTLTGTDAIGSAMTAVEVNVAAACRRAALTSLARATADYQPNSYQDAVQLRELVGGLIAAEMLVAGAVPDYPAYTALRTLRAAVIEDLTARGGNLARLRTVTTAEPMPALVLAYRLYGDASRYDDLVGRADPVSPLFMPCSFQALSA